VITEQHERFFLAALRNLSKFDEGEAVHWANDQMTRFDEAARWRTLEEVCTIVMPISLA
jgi:hypothetical protein